MVKLNKHPKLGWVISLGIAEITIPVFGKDGVLDEVYFEVAEMVKDLHGVIYADVRHTILTYKVDKFDYVLLGEFDRNHKRGRHSNSNNKRRYRQLKIVPIEEDDLPF